MKRAQIDYDLWRLTVFAESDGIKKSREIASIIGKGCTEKYVQGVWVRYPEIPRPNQGPPRGRDNPAYRFGKIIDHDGYVLISVPVDHFAARCSLGRKLISRKTAKALEHRVVMANHLGRDLSPNEVIDHIDGCTLNNLPENLRLFRSNKDHLKATIKHHVPKWGIEAHKKLHVPPSLRVLLPKLDTYNHYKRKGVIRLLRILHAHAVLDKEVHDLSYTMPHIEKAQVDLRDFLKSKQSAFEYLLSLGFLDMHG
jgi:hypothetical protein